MPTTPDKSLGFYRKWFILDFPNQFKEISKDLIEEIPEVEFENLAKKSLRILKELYETKKFHNEGDFDERVKRYEERSNPVIRFVEEFCIEEEGVMISLREFTNYCNQFLQSKHLKILSAKQIGRTLREDGFMVGNRKIGEISAVSITNLGLTKDEKLLSLLKLFKSQIKNYKETKSDNDSNESNNSFKEELDKLTDEEKQIIKDQNLTEEQISTLIKARMDEK